MDHGPTWGHRRRLAALTLVLATAGAALAGSSVAGRAAGGCPAPALSPSTFEIDGNLTADCAGAIDWSSLTPSTTQAAVPDVAVGVDRPSGTSDDSFGMGAKENSTSVGIVTGSIPPNKNDLTRFYVSSESVSNTPFLYLAWERAVNIGSADMDFEIDQHPQPAFTPGATVTLNRTPGDLLVLFEFSGSGTPMIQVATWQGSAWGPTTTLSAGSGALAAVNTGTVPDPLNGGASLTTGLFGEAAINLQTVFGGQCENFSNAYVKARTSGNSFGSELKDFIAPIPVSVESCVTPPVTTRQSPASGTVGSTLFGDSATLSQVAGSVAGEPVTFRLFGPFPSSTSTFDCTTSPATSPSLVATETGTLTQASGSSTATASFTSSNALTQVGTYFWVAYYGGDTPTGKNLASQGGCTDEPITVAQATPSISSTATEPAAGITVGTTATISDSATLRSAFQPTGSVSFSLNGPFTGGGTPSCTSSNQVISGVTGAVSGGTASTGDQSFSPTAAGTYYWVATYPGDTDNQAAGPTGCGDPDEAITVSPATPVIESTILLGDSVQLSTAVTGAGSPSGSVTFSLYGPFTDPSAISCGGTALSAQTVALASDGTASTSTPVAVAPGVYAWQVAYTSTNPNFGPATTTCTAEQASVTYQSPSPIH